MDQTQPKNPQPSPEIHHRTRKQHLKAQKKPKPKTRQERVDECIRELRQKSGYARDILMRLLTTVEAEYLETVMKERERELAETIEERDHYKRMLLDMKQMIQTGVPHD